MRRTALLLAGLAAALAIGAVASGPGAAAPPSGETSWVEHQTAEVTAGQAYRLDACLTVTAPGAEVATLRAAWFARTDGTGSAIYRDDLQANTGLIGVEQCLTMSGLVAPCAARSVAYGVRVVGDASAVSVSSLDLTPDPSTAPIPCPTPAPAPTPIPTPPPAPSPTVKPPPAAPVTTPAPEVEPSSFPALVNGGFEQLRDDGTPYAWRRVGGELLSSDARRAEGRRSAALVSRTDSTKWLYQTVAVQGGSYYHLSALALKDGPAAREALLRISWYASADGSGSQISTADSEPLTGDHATFAPLDTGPAQAPAEARSARLRLLLRPASAALATVYFDDVRFQETDAPPTAAEATVGPTGSGQPRAAAASRAPRPGAAALSVWAGPTPLANSGQASESAAPAGGGGRPLWPFLLALAAPAIALPLLAIGARRPEDRSEREV